MTDLKKIKLNRIEIVYIVENNAFHLLRIQMNSDIDMKHPPYLLNTFNIIFLWLYCLTMFIFF